jgi:hypothetical protein
MIEVVGNLWTYPADFRVITTNGATRGDGLAVMGRGCALEAKKRYPKLARLLGERLRARGNHVQFFSDREIGDRLGLFTFPVKHRWDQPADLDLIRRSTEEFARQLLASSTYVLPLEWVATVNEGVPGQTDDAERMYRILVGQEDV